MTSNIIQALWIGDRLNVMERLGGEILDGGVVTAAILRRVPQRISPGAWFWSRRLRQRFRRG